MELITQVEHHFKSFKIAIFSPLPLALIIFVGVVQSAPDNKYIYEMVKNESDPIRVLSEIISKKVGLSQILTSKDEESKKLELAIKEDIYQNLMKEIKERNLEDIIKEDPLFITTMLGDYFPQSYNDQKISILNISISLDATIQIYIVYVLLSILYASRCLSSILSFYKSGETTDKAEIELFLSSQPSIINPFQRIKTIEYEKSSTPKKNIEKIGCIIYDSIPLIILFFILISYNVLILLVSSKAFAPWVIYGGTIREIGGFSPIVVGMFFLAIFTAITFVFLSIISWYDCIINSELETGTRITIIFIVIVLSYPLLSMVINTAINSF